MSAAKEATAVIAASVTAMFPMRRTLSAACLVHGFVALNGKLHTLIS
jgi:hypothetical protein